MSGRNEVSLLPPADPAGRPSLSKNRLPALFPGGDFQSILAGIYPLWRYSSVLEPNRFTIAVGPDASLGVEVTSGARGGRWLILCHGFTGNADSPLMLLAAAEAHRRGYAVVRVNFRNAADTHGLSKGLFTLLQWPDVARVIEYLHERFAPDRLYALGFSVGGNFVLNVLARDPRVGQLVAAAAAISPPIDIARAAAHVCLPRNFVYHRTFVAALINKIRAKRSLGEVYSDPERPRITTVPEYDTRYVLPEIGYNSLARYYEDASPKDYLNHITVPTMILASRDDPIVPFQMFEDLRAQPKTVQCKITDRGGHVGFLYWGQWHMRSWAIELSLDYFDGHP